MKRILIERDPSPIKLEVLNVDDWALISEPVGVTERQYKNTETSYIIEGAGKIEVKGGEDVFFIEGDLLTILPDTTCIWNVTETTERNCKQG